MIYFQKEMISNSLKQQPYHTYCVTLSSGMSILFLNFAIPSTLFVVTVIEHVPMHHTANAIHNTITYTTTPVRAQNSSKSLITNAANATATASTKP